MAKKLPLLTEKALGELRSLQHAPASLLEQGSYLTTCSKGCSHCCYYPVLLVPLEGLALFRWLEARFLWTQQLRTRLELHHQSVWGQSMEVWLLSQTSCPFLVEDHCTVYSSRPFMCRTVISYKDPESCHPHRFEGVSTLTALRQDMTRHLERLSKEAKVPLMSLPLSTAVLMGSKIDDEDFVAYLKDLLNES